MKIKVTQGVNDDTLYFAKFEILESAPFGTAFLLNRYNTDKVGFSHNSVGCSSAYLTGYTKEDIERKINDSIEAFKSEVALRKTEKTETIYII